jgi:hypothetical protein
VAAQDAFLAGLRQRGVRALMRRKNATQVDGSVRLIEYRFTYLLNGFAAYVATEDVERLRALPEVAHVSEPEPVEYHLDRAIDYSLGTQTDPAARRTAVYGANQEFSPATGDAAHPETPRSTKLDGFEGQNINVAIIDSGVDYRHPMFGGIGHGTPFPRVSGQPESAANNKKVIYFYAFNSPVGIQQMISVTELWWPRTRPVTRWTGILPPDLASAPAVMARVLGRPSMARNCSALRRKPRSWPTRFAAPPRTVWAISRSRSKTLLRLSLSCPAAIRDRCR